MNSRDYLDRDITRINRVLKGLGFGVWAVAAFVMIYGVPVAFGPLKNHGIPGAVAWMPSLAADAAMAVAIIAGPVLSSYKVRAGWIGILRWTAAFTTWALQTAGSWLHPGGPDLAGVGLHSLPPALLFVVGEGAAYFVRKMSDVLEAKKRELASAEQRDADRRAHLAEVESNLRALTVELESANRKAADLGNQLDSVYADRDAERTATALTDERNGKEIGELRQALTAVRESLTGERDDAIRRLTEERDEAVRQLTAEHDDAIKRLKDRHREALTAARTETKPVSLTAYRERATGKATAALTGKPVLSDETAVQMMLDAHDDPDFEWSQNAVRTLTGVGLDRAKRLIPMWLTAVTGEAPGEDQAVNQ
jgi:hypothetical protein